MISEDPDITRPRSWCRRKGRDDLVVRIVGRTENHIDLAGRETTQSRIDIDVERSEFAQFQLEDFQIPASIERDFIVGDPERSLLGL